MPHAVYLDPFIVCPWLGCGFRIAMVDFRLELGGDPAKYARVIRDWGAVPGFGLVGLCPHCRQYVIFRVDSKQAASSPPQGMDSLPDNWHETADIFEEIP
jgi:hypothetical protein